LNGGWWAVLAMWLTFAVQGNIGKNSDIIVEVFGIYLYKNALPELA